MCTSCGSLRLLLGVLVGLALGFAPAPFPRKEREQKRDDFATMQGMWRMTYQESSGSAHSHNYEVRIKGNRWAFILVSDQGREGSGGRYYLTVDQRAVPPALEWAYDEERTSGWVASYRLRGRQLIVIYDKGTLKNNGRRPTDFEGRVPHKMIFEYIGPE